MKTILSIGEATLDSFMFVHDANVHCTLDKKKCEFCLNYADKIMADDLVFSVGGNAANTAVSFSRLGHRSQLYSVRGDDWIGEQIHKTLVKENIDPKYLVVEEGPSSFANAIVFQGERNLVIYHVPREYYLPGFEPVDWVYLTSMGKAFMPAYNKAIKYIKDNKIKLSFNHGSNQLKAGLETLIPILKETTCLFLNTDEARTLTGLPAESTIREMSEKLYDLGPDVVVITDGAGGGYAFDGRQLLFCDIFPAKVIERTGAGDSFAAGFTAAMLDGQDISEAMRWGMANSAGVVGKIGPEAGLLTKEEMEEALDKNSGIQAKVVR